MKVVRRTLEFSTKGNTDIINITDMVAEEVNKAGVRDGMVLIFVPGATGALTTIEYEPGLVYDFQQFFERVAPQGIVYAHNGHWGDMNGHSHVRASLLGPSLTVPVTDGKLELGTWQSIVFVDFDNRSRERRLILKILGE